MRKILNFSSVGLFTAAKCGLSVKLMLAALAVVTSCFGSTAFGQTSRELVAPAAMSFTDGSISSAIAFGDQASNAEPTVDAAYSILSDTSAVEQASHRGPGPRARAAYCSPNVNPCYAGCDVSMYFNYEALWLTRDGGDFYTLSRNTFLADDWGYEFGGRYTIGQLSDCVNGWEVSYVGPFDWQRSRDSVDNFGNLQSQLFPTNGYTPADINAFNNANQHRQSWRARLNSYEFNRRWWVWDVLSTLVGVRYIDYEEDFTFFSFQNAGLNTPSAAGLLTESVDNEMLGLQIGGDLIYPMTLRSNMGIRGKAGVYANSADRRAFVNNNGTILVNSGDSDIDVAGVFELGVYYNYHILPSVRLTTGYEFWWMTGVATIPDQLPTLITPASGTSVSISDDVFFHGGSIGVQVLY